MNSIGGSEISPASISLSRAEKKDLKAVARFSKEMRHENIKLLPFDKKELFEKYKAHGKGKGLNLFLLKDRGSLIGCAGYNQFKGAIASKNVDGIVANALIVDPKYRRLSPAAAVILGRSYKDLIFENKLFSLFVPLDDEMSFLYKKRPFENFTYLYQFMNHFIAKIKPAQIKSQIKIKRIKRFAKKEMDLFFHKISKQHSFLMHSDTNLLNWKYSKNPYYNFVILNAVLNGEVIGYIVITKIGTDIYIVDLTVNLNYPSAILLLMFKSFGCFDTGNITNTIICATHKSYMEILKKAGFFCSWKRECLFFPESLSFFNISKSDFNSLDKDFYHLNGYVRHLY